MQLLCLIYGPGDAERILEKSTCGLESAANKYQWAIINGLYDNINARISVINSIPMGSFPKKNKILLEKPYINESKTASIRNIGFVNLPIVKQVSRELKAYFALKSIIDNGSQKETIVVYSLYLPYLKALYKLKKEGKNFNYILIVPDLPLQYGHVCKEGHLLSKIKYLYGHLTLKLSRYADGYVLLTDQMRNALDIKNKPFRIIEGVYDIEESMPVYKVSSNKAILFTGTIDYDYGIENLIKAFKLIDDPSVELWIAGKGNYESELLSQIRKDDRIKYFGYCTRDKINDLQSRAAVLVNPRQSSEEYTKYSFPSKTMEYLATGKPVVMNKLLGMPHEYDPYLHYTHNSSAEALSEKLLEVLNYSNDYLEQIAIRQITFVRKYKNSTVQAKKVLELIYEIEGML